MNINFEQRKQYVNKCSCLNRFIITNHNYHYNLYYGSEHNSLLLYKFC